MLNAKHVSILLLNITRRSCGLCDKELSSNVLIPGLQKRAVRKRKEGEMKRPGARPGSGCACVLVLVPSGGASSSPAARQRSCDLAAAAAALRSTDAPRHSLVSPGQYRVQGEKKTKEEEEEEKKWMEEKTKIERERKKKEGREEQEGGGECKKGEIKGNKK